MSKKKTKKSKKRYKNDKISKKCQRGRIVVRHAVLVIRILEETHDNGFLEIFRILWVSPLTKKSGRFLFSLFFTKLYFHDKTLLFSCRISVISAESKNTLSNLSIENLSYLCIWITLGYMRKWNFDLSGIWPLLTFRHVRFDRSRLSQRGKKSFIKLYSTRVIWCWHQRKGNR